jgi:glycolate oxidase iron-sulfur subunit
MTKDLSEVIPERSIEKKGRSTRVAFQAPCSLQHAQQIQGKVESLLGAAGYQ